MSEFENLTIIDRLNITLDNLNMTYLIGKIKIYAGTSLPTGYVWCDGTNGTPNLSGNKYIISDLSEGSQQNVGNNQFASNMISHTHTISNTSQLPDEFNMKISPGTFNGTLRNLYTQLSDAFIKRPNASEQTQQHGPDTNVEKGGSRERSNEHKHELGNQQAPNCSFTSTVQHTMLSNSPFQQHRDVSVGNTGSDDDYLPPYIYIGFIMKNPSTWL